MDATVLLAIPLGIAIGLVVGAIGGGGGVLGLPVLIYVLGEPIGPASTASLIVVAVAASVGAGALALRGHVCWRAALTFAAPAAAGSLLGTIGNNAVSGRVLILSFVPVMLAASMATWQRAARSAGEETGPCPDPRLGRIVLAGVAVGALTGFFGVGGGFMIVPVLILGLGFGFRRAVATSLVILTLTGIAGLMSHIAVGAAMNVPLTVVLSASTGVGAICGSIVSQRVPQAVVGRAFAIVVALVALFLLVDTVLLGGPPGD
ncbi:MAG TPA: sulfite exporter TauE/SafE family protein [Solirubrobacteraceae bacterium]|nr:sulfite exporter TauE/SafE family protein [Solirubrobacteraceae bacterium]